MRFHETLIYYQQVVVRGRMENGLRREKRQSNEWRCECGKLLFKGTLMVGVMEVKCPRCKRMVYIQEFESVTTSQPSLFMVVGLDGEILTVSDSAREVFGYTKEYAVGRNLSEVLNRNARLVMRFWLKKIAKKSPEDFVPFTSRMAIKHIDGHWITVTFFARVMDYRSRRVIFGVAELGNEPIARYAAHAIKLGNTIPTIQDDTWDFTTDRSQTILTVSCKNQLGLDNSCVGKKLFDYLPEQGNFTASNTARIMERGDNYVDRIELGEGAHKQAFEISLTTDIHTVDHTQDYLVSSLKL